MNKFKIVLIACYIGKFPDNFSLWLKSCEYNSSIDFLVITDQNPPKMYPSNVKFMKSNLKSLKSRFQKQLDFKIKLETPYKLCDYKPIYGLAFSDEVRNYDYWGHCDIDLIWGDIRKFVTNDLLSSFDRIGYPGHLSIYKNYDVVNNAFKLNGSVFNYREVFSNSENYGFDEMTGMNLIFRKNGLSFYENVNHADIIPACSRIRTNQNNFKTQLFYWQEGKCYCSYVKDNIIESEEYAYIHYQKRNLTITNFDYKDLSAFWIKNDRFLKKENVEITLTQLQEQNENISRIKQLFEKYEYKLYKLKQILMRNRKNKKIWLRQRLGIYKYYRGV